MPVGRVLSAVRWAVPALMLAACVTGGAFALEAAALGRPSRNQLLGAAAVGKLVSTRVMRSDVRLGAERLRGTCLEGRFRFRVGGRRRTMRGTLVMLSDGTLLYDFGGGVKTRRARARASLEQARQFLLAGCPRTLANLIGAHLKVGRGFSFRRDRGAGTTTDEIKLLDHGRRFGLDLAPRTLRPLRLDVRGHSWNGSSLLLPGHRRSAAALARGFGLALVSRRR